MSENITVAARIRPLNENELNNHDESIWSANSPYKNSISLSPSCLCNFVEQGKLPSVSSLKFNFSTFVYILELCMDGQASNFTLFNTLVKPIAESFLQGINDTVIMYGPTGSGKTFTMLGDEKTRRDLREMADLDHYVDRGERGSEPGILLYALDYIFKSLINDGGINAVKVSYIEIYNDNIYDLLQDKSMLSNTLSINEVESGKFG